MIACIHWSVAADNPYAVAQAIVITVLIIAFPLWRVAGPPPQMILRGLVMISAVVTFLSVLVGAGGWTGDARPITLLTLQASMLLAGCLVVELIAALRVQRIPRAEVHRQGDDLEQRRDQPGRGLAEPGA